MVKRSIPRVQIGLGALGLLWKLLICANSQMALRLQVL